MSKRENKIVGWIDRLADLSASPGAFALAAFSIIFWSAMGSAMPVSSGWEFAINIVSNAGTFLVVFLIQNAQKRTRVSLEQKLDRLLLQSARRPLTAQEIRLIVEAELPRASNLKEYFAVSKQNAHVLH